MFSAQRPVVFPADTPPKLLVVIDTEEEFDWYQPARRESTGVSAMKFMDRVQDIFRDYDICPCYVIDYPVASQPEGYQLLKEYAEAGECEIGAHLHPWVSPPLTEILTPAHTYPGNLPAEQERDKLRQLKATIQKHFGQAPTAYKAGRYGFGPNTEALLADEGFAIDLSVCPPVDHGADGGPDYRDFNAEPFWFGTDKLLEIPVTGALVGWSGALSRPLFELGQRLNRIKVPGILSRLRAVDRLMLSPEGFTPDEHQRLTRFLYQRGLRTFTWSFHSPSVVPGHTPYVNSEKELQQFLDSFRTFFDFFFEELGGVATSPARLKYELETTP